MTIEVPRPLRVALYVITAIGGPLVVWLVEQGHIGAEWLGLWTAETSVVAAMAGFQVPGKQAGKHAVGNTPAAPVDDLEPDVLPGQGRSLADPAVHDDLDDEVVKA